MVYSIYLKDLFIVYMLKACPSLKTGVNSDRFQNGTSRSVLLCMLYLFIRFHSCICSVGTLYVKPEVGETFK